MDQSLNDSQRSRVEFLNQEDLLRLYAIELYGISSKSLPANEIWVDKMESIQKGAKNRNDMTDSHDIHDTIARVMFRIVKQHQLDDWNKYSSILCMTEMYKLNGYKVMLDSKMLDEKAEEIAKMDSQTIDDEKVIAQLKEFLQQGIEEI